MIRPAFEVPVIPDASSIPGRSMLGAGLGVLDVGARTGAARADASVLGVAGGGLEELAVGGFVVGFTCTTARAVGAVTIDGADV
jgi:hypothetical protein